ncbi:MAG: nuclease-related domain-containing protein [Clostridium sp.]
MGLFRNFKTKNSSDKKIINESLNDNALNLSLLEEKIVASDTKELSLLENDLVSVLLEVKDDKSKILWNLYIPTNIDNKIIYKYINCILIRNDTIFVFSCEDYKGCIGFKEINNEFWEFEYFTELKLEKNPITTATETAYVLSKFLNLDKKFNLFVPIVILVGANSSKNIFSVDSNHIYLRDSHRRFLKDKLISILSKKNEDILSDKWVFKITNKLFPLMNPDKKTLKVIKKSLVL